MPLVDRVQQGCRVLKGLALQTLPQRCGPEEKGHHQRAVLWSSDPPATSIQPPTRGARLQSNGSKSTRLKQSSNEYCEDACHRETLSTRDDIDGLLRLGRPCRNAQRWEREGRLPVDQPLGRC